MRLAVLPCICLFAVQMQGQIEKSSQQNSQFAISEFAFSREHEQLRGTRRGSYTRTLRTNPEMLIVYVSHRQLYARTPAID